MSSPWRNFANVLSNVKNIVIRIFPPTLLEPHINHTTQSVEVPPLSFPELPNRLPLLLDLGASEDHANLLYAQFIKAAQNVDATLTQQYYADVPKLWDSSLFTAGSRATYIQANQTHLILLRTQTIERLWNALFSWTQIRFACPPTGEEASITDRAIICAPSSKRKRQGRPSSFTAEQTFALSALFAREDQYSPEDKEFIAQTLNLTRDQVNRWFCNARARKKSTSRLPRRCGSLDSVRTVSSDLTSSESQQADQGATISEVTNSTPGFNDTSPAFTIHTPGTAPELANSTPGGLNNPGTEFTSPTLEVDSLDAYLDYSAYLKSGQSPGEGLTHNLPTQHDPITSWSEDLNMTIPALSTSSSVESRVAITGVPFDTPLCPEPQDGSCDVTSFNDPLFNPLDFNHVLFPPPCAPESQPSKDVLYSLDLSQW